MTRDDVIIAIPWIIFGIGMSAIGIRLLGARHAAGPGPGKSRPGRARSGAAGPAESTWGRETISSHPVQEDQRP